MKITSILFAVALTLSASPSYADWTVLHQGNGTHSAGAFTDVDSVAISGLTTADTLVVFSSLSSAGAQSGAVALRNATDGVSMVSVSSGNISAGSNRASTAFIRNNASSLTSVGSAAVTSSSTQVGVSSAAAFTTNWTGNWTLALRAAPVDAGGTLSYNWTVYKVDGQ